MRKLHESVVQAVSGAFGLLFGLLSAIAVGLAAVAAPALGLLAVLAAPLRALFERLRRGSHSPG